MGKCTVFPGYTKCTQRGLAKAPWGAVEPPNILHPKPVPIVGIRTLLDSK